MKFFLTTRDILREKVIFLSEHFKMVRQKNLRKTAQNLSPFFCLQKVYYFEWLVPDPASDLVDPISCSSYSEKCIRLGKQYQIYKISKG